MSETPVAVSRYPRSEPVSMIWSFPHQINLTFGRRAKRLHQYPACGGAGAGGREHSLISAFQATDWFRAGNAKDIVWRPHGSQFTSSGSCNPTLTIVALAIRQAD